MVLLFDARELEYKSVAESLFMIVKYSKSTELETLTKTFSAEPDTAVSKEEFSDPQISILMAFNMFINEHIRDLIELIVTPDRFRALEAFMASTNIRLLQDPPLQQDPAALQHSANVYDLYESWLTANRGSPDTLGELEAFDRYCMGLSQMDPTYLRYMRSQWLRTFGEMKQAKDAADAAVQESNTDPRLRRTIASNEASQHQHNTRKRTREQDPADDEEDDQDDEGEEANQVGKQRKKQRTDKPRSAATSTSRTQPVNPAPATATDDPFAMQVPNDYLAATDLLLGSTTVAAPVVPAPVSTQPVIAARNLRGRPLAPESDDPEVNKKREQNRASQAKSRAKQKLKKANPAGGIEEPKKTRKKHVHQRDQVQTEAAESPSPPQSSAQLPLSTEVAYGQTIGQQPATQNAVVPSALLNADTTAMPLESLQALVDFNQVLEETVNLDDPTALDQETAQSNAEPADSGGSHGHNLRSRSNRTQRK